MKSPSAPFTVLGWLAIIAAGFIAAAVAPAPTEHLVWMVAYLVLIVGAAQYALGRGLARFARKPPTAASTWTQWVLLNLGHAGIIAGTLAGLFALVATATIPYWIAVAWLGLTARPQEGRSGLAWYRVLVIVLLASALIGVFLSHRIH